MDLDLDIDALQLLTGGEAQLMTPTPGPHCTLSCLATCYYSCDISCDITLTP